LKVTVFVNAVQIVEDVKGESRNCGLALRTVEVVTIVENVQVEKAGIVEGC
jgi:hypothetical protein